MQPFDPNRREQQRHTTPYTGGQTGRISRGTISSDGPATRSISFDSPDLESRRFPSTARDQRGDDGHGGNLFTIGIAAVLLFVGYVLVDSAESTPRAGSAGAAGAPAAEAIDEVIVDEDPGETLTAATTTVAGDPATTEGCSVSMGAALRSGSSGADVVCLQQALIKLGYLQGEATGTYGPLTVEAVTKLQTDRELFVDGDAGRETAISLGIWPDEGEFVVRTPVPAAGAKDLTGYPLSSVASAGADAPPLPADSGTGRRIVYDRKGQRVWAVNKEGEILRSWLVSGSMYDNETPGTHKVYSRSEYTTAWNGKATLKYMVRWLKTDIGAIGFHQIPVRRSDKKVYQTEEELGTRLSGGCQRQAKFDAEFLWKFATVGTKVVVI